MKIEISKVEIPVGYRIGEIANTASVLVDELVQTKIRGTEGWPFTKDLWLARIQGQVKDKTTGERIKRFDMEAEGLKVGYRGYLDNLIHMERRGISILFDEPKLLVFTDENMLKPQEFANVCDVVNFISNGYMLREETPRSTLVFPKEKYATEIVVFPAGPLNIH